MASNRLLLINNCIQQIGNEFLYTSGSSSTGIYIITKGNKQDMTKEIKNRVRDIITEETQHEFFKYLPNDEPIERVNSILGIHGVYTPLYNLLTKFAGTEKNKIILNPLTGKQDNLTIIWERKYRLKFLADEIVKYSRLISIFKPLINNGLKYNKDNPALRLTHNGNKIMSLFYIEDGKTIINPFNWIPTLYKTQLYQLVFDESNVEEIKTFDIPLIFKINTHRDMIINLLGTSYDILQLCNIDLNINLKDSDLVLLIGGLALTTLGATNENSHLPLQGLIYYVLNTDDENNSYIRDEQLDKNLIRLIDGDKVVSRTLMQVFLNRIFEPEEAIKYTGQFEKGRLI